MKGHDGCGSGVTGHASPIDGAALFAGVDLQAVCKLFPDGVFDEVRWLSVPDG